MPVVSPKQMRFMYAAKAGKLRGTGPSPEVASEFLEKTPRETRVKFGKSKRGKKK